MRLMLEYFSKLRRSGFEGIEWVSSEGRMGTDWLPEGATIGSVRTTHSSSGSTSADDTAAAVGALLKEGIDLLVYAGGDGTTRDIVAALDSAGSPDTPVIGVPTGVKMHSGCFAASPKAAAEVLSAWLDGDLLLASTEVLDLDEERYRQGEWVVQLYAEAMTPASPRWMQGSKQRIEASGEEDTTEGLADHIRELVISEDGLVIWGSGGTLRAIAEMNGFQPTNLGIDATLGNEQVGTDLDETGLLEILSSHTGPVTLLLSPMGGQGFLIGRGNLQLSPEVLRAIGIDNILGVVTPAKLLTVRRLRIETGDANLDAEFAAKRYMKVLQGYRTTRVLPVAVD
ncbi:MAG: ATP-NAD kinase [Methanobacteriota archaeon]|jgi:predicted polyphosphate/ATP-dependent NAD kinase|nr:MAG: ATP-NAD kinase [Euryarchaeota archaeon]